MATIDNIREQSVLLPGVRNSETETGVILGCVGREHRNQRAAGRRGGLGHCTQFSRGDFTTVRTHQRDTWLLWRYPLDWHQAVKKSVPKDPSNVGHSQLSLRTPGSTLSSQSRVPSSVSPYVEGGVAASISSLLRGRLSSGESVRGASLPDPLGLEEQSDSVLQPWSLWMWSRASGVVRGCVVGAGSTVPFYS